MTKLLWPFLWPSLALANVIPSATPLVLSNVGAGNFFAQAEGPAEGAPAVYGSYTHGCIRGARGLSLEAKDLVVMRPSRRRYFGHPALLEVLERARKAAPRQGPILMGDLAQARGGPMPMGHASHQLGLDADIWFSPEAVLQAGAVNEEQRESLDFETVLDDTRRAVDPRRWRPEFAEQVLWFAAQPEVQRIFVHGAIKKQLCATHRDRPELAKVRPWYFHDSHFHIRLRCPAGETACVGQPDVTELGCDKSIDHWLTPGALRIQRELPKAPIPRTVRLPAECRELGPPGAGLPAPAPATPSEPLPSAPHDAPKEESKGPNRPAARALPPLPPLPKPRPTTPIIAPEKGT